MLRNLLVVVLVSLCLLDSQAEAQVQWGRELEGRKTFGLFLSAGSVYGLEGEVQETSRPIEVIGGPTSGAPPENYSWKELGFDEDFATIGLGFEKMWTYITLQGNFLRGKPKVSSVADRDYYIGVGSVRFQGRDYDYLVIPEGTSYSGEIDLYSFDFRMLITPVTFGSPEHVTFTPWVHVGLFAFIADYELDAGQAERITLYENPPREYVVGGRGTGTTGLLIPELGVGGELRLAFTERVALSLQGHAAFLKYNGKNTDFGVSSRNEKAVDVDYASVGLKASLEIEINRHIDFMGGVEYQRWTGDAEVRATDKDEDTVLELREKFDKDVTFSMSAITFFAGIRF